MQQAGQAAHLDRGVTQIVSDLLGDNLVHDGCRGSLVDAEEIIANLIGIGAIGQAREQNQPALKC